MKRTSRLRRVALFGLWFGALFAQSWAVCALVSAFTPLVSFGDWAIALLSLTALGIVTITVTSAIGNKAIGDDYRATVAAEPRVPAKREAQSLPWAPVPTSPSLYLTINHDAEKKEQAGRGPRGNLDDTPEVYCHFCGNEYPGSGWFILHVGYGGSLAGPDEYGLVEICLACDQGSEHPLSGESKADYEARIEEKARLKREVHWKDTNA